MIADKELAQLFKAESAEHLACLDEGLLKLEKTPADLPLLEEIFRASHSLKGASRMLGLSNIETAAHELETTLNAARHGNAPVTLEAIERMTGVLGELRKLVNIECGVIDCGARNVDFGMESKAESRSSDFGLYTQGAAVPLAEATSATLRSAELTPAQNTAKEQFEISTSPSTAPHPVFHNPHSVVPFHIETVRVETRKLDALLTLAGELVVMNGRTQHRLSLIDELLEKWSMLERRKLNADFIKHSALRCPASATGTIRSTSRGCTPQSAFEQFGITLKGTRDLISEDASRLEATVSALQEQVNAMRLLPLSTVFELFPRMTHDLAKQQGKEIELLIEGGEICVDKRILEEMKDPLMHLLRNAIDHGIELPAEREQSGKHQTGKVWLRAVREGEQLLLEVRDDGQGLDLAKIRQVALQRRLYDETTLAAMSVTQLQQLILLPGFSTSRLVTELSGRGVGLDVVQTNVAHFKGEIRIESVLHQGTTIRLHLPSGFVTSRLLIIAVGEQQYGLPIEFMHRSQLLHTEDMFTLEGNIAFELDGQAVIAPRLAQLLGIPGSGSEMVCIVLRSGDDFLGLRVDALLDEQEVLAKPPGAPMQRVRNVSGLAMLSNGTICVVLNPADLYLTAHKGLQLAELGGPNNLQSLIQTTQSDDISHAAPRTPQAILLVEDSALVRAMEKRILEDAGYEVVTAVDGLDGLDALGRNRIAAVVSDISMPNMDGLTLTSRIRQEARYQDLPVILVTALSSDEDKRRGLEVGANAYIPKPSFDQRLLLDTLKRLI